MPIIFTSCKDKTNILKTIDSACDMATRTHETVPTPKLNAMLELIQRMKSHPASGKIRPKIYYGTQVSAMPAKFLFFTSYPDLFKKEYMRYIEQNLRKRFGFEGIPIQFEFRAKKEDS